MQNRETVRTTDAFSCMSEDILKVFANIIGARDEYTQGHSHHVYVIAETIAGLLPGGMDVDLPKLKNAALLHDIGKILTPDNVLNKKGTLSDEEWEIMRRHPAEGKRLLDGTVFAELGDWILYHHERMDGKGYYGLKGDDIPLESRIIAVADTFSALRTYRPYRASISIEKTIEIMREAAGTQLDAAIVDVLLTLDVDTLENLQCNCEICARRRLELEQRMPEE